VTDELRVPGVPFPLVPAPAGAWAVSAGAVAATAGPRTDIFIDPGPLVAEPTLNATTLLGPAPAGDWQLSARVSVEFTATYDAGVLLLWLDDRNWAKLCFEFSPADEPMVVSVVCRGVADDANAFVVAGRTLWLRVSRIDRAYAYHASVDGLSWQLIRYFAVSGSPGEARLGFSAQSPTGEGCRVTFDDIRFTPSRLAALRDGS
jgi:regulation of enolase protein 1 (concanavalin A-like superfamily)